MGKAVKRVLAVLLTIILLVVVVVGCYIAYLMITYNRIADKTHPQSFPASGSFLMSGLFA